MSVGLGVLLGLSLLSFTILFVATRERWPWKRIVIGVLTVLVVLPSVGIGGVYLWSRIRMYVVPESELWGVRLGMAKKEVVFRKGPPQDSTSSLDSDGTVSEKWSYTEAFAPRYTIYFRRDSVDWVVAHETESGGAIPSLGGVSGYDSQEAVEKKLGPPTFSSTSSDGTSRILSYASMRLFVILARNEVDGIGVYRPTGRHKAIRFVDEDSTLSR